MSLGMKKYIVYCHTNKKNQKRYIGITCNSVKRRWGNGSGYVHCPLFYRAIKKYGWDGFYHEILESELSKDAAQSAEQAYISRFQSNDPAHGYNLTSGGEVNKKISPQTRERLVKSHLGIRPTEETLRRRSKSLSASWTSKLARENHMRAIERFIHSSAYKEKISEASKKNWATPEYVKKQKAGMKVAAQKGSYHAKLSESLKKAWSKPETRAKVSGENNGKAKGVICTDTGEIFPCAAEAGRAKNISINSICMCCRGERKHAGKLQWKFVEQRRGSCGKKS